MRKNFIISVLISFIALLSCFRVQSKQVTEVSVLSDKPGAEPLNFNTIANPRLIYPASSAVKVAGRKLNADLDRASVNVFIIDFRTR
jgi:hypothetical protein